MSAETTTPVTVPGIYELTDAVYHADPVEGGSLSSTGAKALLRSPARFRYDREHPVQKKAYDLGHVVHAKVLGVGMDIVEVKYDSWRTRAAKTARAEAYLAGKIAMLTHELAPAVEMAEAVLAHPLARALFERPGQSEASLFATDPGSGVVLRARIDHLPDATERRTICVDLKTAESAYPPDFRRSAADFGYDIQRAWYPHVLSLVRGDHDPAFVFVVVEKCRPHLVSVIEMDPTFAEVGRTRMRRAIEIYRRCRDSGQWPGYAPVVHTIEPPVWLTYAEEAQTA